jgi:galactose oxidase-like protein/Kelch motif protein
MTTPRDPDELLAAYLAQGMETLPDRVVDAVLDEIHRTRQQAVIGLWRTRSMSRTALGAAAVVAVLVLGGTFYLTRPSQPAIGGPSPTPGVSSSPGESASPPATASPALVSSPTLVEPRAPSWTVTGSLISPRGGAGGTATLLFDGRVLTTGVAGASAELYDPTTATWTPTGSMGTTRSGHTATLLADGKVLVAGGRDHNSHPLASAELYDPATGSWTPTRNMAAKRTNQTATLLADGTVLVAGGASGDGSAALASAERYDPRSETWSAVAPMTEARAFQTATLLPDGKVLVVGGFPSLLMPPPLASAELYDPVTRSWSATATLVAPRVYHTATLLPDGRVLVAGNSRSVELYDPRSGSWTATSDLSEFRQGHTATLLLDGTVLVADGYADGGALSSAEIYDPITGTWTVTGETWGPGDDVGTGIRGPDTTATLLLDGKVLVTDGRSAKLYDPGTKR